MLLLSEVPLYGTWREGGRVGGFEMMKPILVGTLEVVLGGLTLSPQPSALNSQP